MAINFPLHNDGSAIKYLKSGIWRTEKYVFSGQRNPFSRCDIPFLSQKTQVFLTKNEKGPSLSVTKYFFSHKKQTLFSFMINRFRVSSRTLPCSVAGVGWKQTNMGENVKNMNK
jgi:hypothetical protein